MVPPSVCPEEKAVMVKEEREPIRHHDEEEWVKER